MTNTPMTFEEWWNDLFKDLQNDAVWSRDELHNLATMSWQASQAQQAQSIAELREQIQRLGEMANICTYSELGEVCSYCNCKRKVKGK